MGINLAGILVLGVLIVVLTLMAMASIVSSTAVGLSSTSAVERAGERARTELIFVNAEGGGTALTFQINNTGLTSIYDYAHMDFIVDYIDTADNKVVTYLTYTTGALGANQWKKTSISPDTYQPNAWNPEETITLDAVLSPAQKNDTTATAAVVSPNGIAAVSIFSPKGFFWFTNAIDISLTITGSWQDIDLSAYVPAGTAGAVVELVNTVNTSGLSGVVRGKEDTRDYMSNTNFEAMYKNTHRWQIVKVDSNRLIQGYIENVAIDFKLRGYTLGTDPSYINTPPNLTIANNTQWETVDVSAYVDADADGVILLVDSIDTVTKKYAIREVGSTFLDPTGPDKHKLGGYSNTMYLVGINGADQFEAWLEKITTLKIYLVGQTKGSVVYYTEDVAVSDPTAGSWQEIDADTYTVPAEANGLFFRAGALNAKDKKLGFRHGDSTDDWNGDLRSDVHLIAGTGIRADNVWDEFMEDTKAEVFIAAYTKALTN